MFSQIKQSVPELVAAATFVNEIMTGTRARWRLILGLMEPVLSDRDRETLQDNWSQFEFALACIAMEGQAIRNLLGEKQGARVAFAVRRSLDSPALEGVGLESLNEYEAAWRSALSQGEPPWFGVASAFYDRVGLTARTSLGDATFKDPLLLTALVDAMSKPVHGWWKTFLGSHELVQD